jgi:Mg/Co/Ni transporter MgtE
MVRVVVKVPEEQRREVFQGSEKEVAERLRDRFPEETMHAGRLMSIIEAIQADGIAEVNFEVMREPLESNLLPDDFLTADQGDDPWVRPS